MALQHPTVEAYVQHGEASTPEHALRLVKERHSEDVHAWSNQFDSHPNHVDYDALDLAQDRSEQDLTATPSATAEAIDWMRQQAVGNITPAFEELTAFKRRAR